jgi:hypothetical protein
MSGFTMDPAAFAPSGRRWVLTFRGDLPVNATDAWIAVASRDGLRGWFPAVIVGEWTAGRDLAFYVPDDEADEPVWGEVVDAEIGRLLAFVWGADSLRITLEPYDAGTRLVFAVSLDARGRGVHEAVRWHVCLAHLRESVGGYVEDADKDHDALFRRYRTAFGEDAAALPPAC